MVVGLRGGWVVATAPKLNRASLVLTTVGSGATAAKLARALLDARVCACVSVVPQVRSLYRWQGELRDEREVLLLIKTAPRRLAALRRALATLHPYAVPEVLVLSAATHSAYARWLARCGNVGSGPRTS